MSSVARVGQPVQFFKSGQPDGDARATIVTGCNEEGVAELVELPKHGGTTIAHLGVRHADDPWHQTHPEISRQNGCWAFIHEDKPDTPKSLPEPKGRK